MTLLVIAYPEIAANDLSWIQDFRAQHDEVVFRLLSAHFTFVFPVNDLEPAAFIKHIRETAAGVAAIPFVIRSALVVKDQLSPASHIFLVPDEGFSRIVKLHDRFYTGLLTPELRLDIPFIPHVTIGNLIDPLRCIALVDELNAQDFEIGGTITALDVIEESDGNITTIERIKLANTI